MKRAKGGKGRFIWVEKVAEEIYVMCVCMIYVCIMMLMMGEHDGVRMCVLAVWLD